MLKCINDQMLWFLRQLDLTLELQNHTLSKRFGKLEIPLSFRCGNISILNLSCNNFKSFSIILSLCSHDR